MKTFFLILFSFVSVSVYADTYYDSGIEALKKGKYERAVKEFRKSKEKDVMKGIVTESQVNAKLREAEMNFLKEKVAEAQKYEKEKRLKKALSAVKDAKDLVPDDKRVNQMVADYEKHIADLENQVKDGRELLDKKEYLSAYNFFKKLMPYEDTLSSIGSGYDSAVSGLVKGFKNEAEISEKNGNFDGAVKSLKNALVYKADDKSLKREIERLQNRIEAKNLLQKGTASKGRGNEEAAFNTLLEAYNKDRDNPEIKASLTLMKNDMAGRWADRAVDLEGRGQTKEAYILVEKAINSEPEDKAVRNRLDGLKKSLSVKLADQYRQKADHMNSDPELSYLYLVAATSLDSSLKDSKKRVEEIKANLEQKACYKLSYNIDVAKGVVVPAGDNLKETIKEKLEKEISGLIRKHCITLSNEGRSDGQLFAKVTSYTFTEQKQNFPHKVKYNDTFQKNSNYDYDRILSELKIKSANVYQKHSDYKNYSDALLKHVAARDEIKYVQADVKKYREKEYESKKDAAKKNNEKFSLDKDSISTPYDNRLKELTETLKTSKDTVKQAWNSVSDTTKKEIKDQQKEIEKLSDRLADTEKFRLSPVEKWTEYNDIVTKVMGKVELEVNVKDNTTNKLLANVKRFSTFSDESRGTPSLVVFTEAGKQELSREERGKKIPTLEEIKRSLLEKTVKEVGKGIDDSNLKYHGDRFYFLFTSAKDRAPKTKNALLTNISNRNLSDSRRYVDDVLGFIKKEYGVDMKREKVEVSETTKL